MSPVSLSPEELLAVAQELKATLQEAVVRQVTALSDSRVYLALGWRGEEVLLHACCERGEARLSVVDEQPAGPPRPPGWQAPRRRELVGGVLCSVDATPERALLTLSFSRSQRAIRLELECTDTPAVVLVSDGRVRACSPRPGLVPGAVWLMPALRPLTPAPSRLSRTDSFLPLSRAAERLFAQPGKPTN